MSCPNPKVAPYDEFSTGCGEIFLGIDNDGQFRKFCAFIGAPEMAADPRYASNGERNRDALRASIEALLADRDATELCEALLKAGMPAGPVHSLPEALEHPHTRRRMVLDLGAGQRGLGVAVKLSRTPGHAPAPTIGQRTREVVGTLGYLESEIDALVDTGVAPYAPDASPGQAAGRPGPGLVIASMGIS